MEISDKIYKDKKGITRLRHSMQRVADIMFRINSGWDEEKVARSREISINGVRDARKYYQTHRKEIDSQIASIYGEWKEPIKFSPGYVPVIQNRRIVGYRRPAIGEEKYKKVSSG